MSSTEWGRAKALEMVEHEIELISVSKAPDEAFCNGLIQAFYALGSLNDRQLDQLTQDAAATVRRRRAELNKARIQNAIERAV